MHSYAKLVEMRRHMDYFKSSGKSLIAYMDSGAEKEYFLALGCDEVGGCLYVYVGVCACMVCLSVCTRVCGGDGRVGARADCTGMCMYRHTHAVMNVGGRWCSCTLSDTYPPLAHHNPTGHRRQIYMPPGGALRLQVDM